MIYQKLCETAIYPFYHWLKKDGANAAIRELDRNELLGREELNQITLTKMKRLLVHAAKSVPYYQKQLQAFHATSSLSVVHQAFLSLPTLSKATINENLQSMISTDLVGNGLDSVEMYDPLGHFV